MAIKGQRNAVECFRSSSGDKHTFAHSRIEGEIRVYSYPVTTSGHRTNEAVGDLLVIFIFGYFFMFGHRWRYIGYVTALGMYHIYIYYICIYIYTLVCICSFI